MTTSEYLKPEECNHGYLYRINARNFQYGVYNQRVQGFIGVREKFGSEYLFTEYHWDTGGTFGTVQPIEELEECPVKDLSEQFLLCDCHHQPVIHVRKTHGDPEFEAVPEDKRFGDWIIVRRHWDDTPLMHERYDVPAEAHYHNNFVLFNYLSAAAAAREERTDG